MAKALNPLAGDTEAQKLASAEQGESLGGYTVGDLNSYLQLQQQAARAQLPISGNVVSDTTMDQTVRRSLNLGGDSMLQVDGISGSSGQLLQVSPQGGTILSSTLTSPTLTGTVTLTNGATMNAQGVVGTFMSGIWTFQGTLNLAAGAILNLDATSQIKVGGVLMQKQRLLSADPNFNPIIVDAAGEMGMAFQNAFGGDHLSEPFDPMMADTAMNFVDGRIWFVANYLPYAVTVTGVWLRNMTGATAVTYDNQNGVAMYAGLGSSVFTLLRTSTNAGGPLHNTTGYLKIPFTSTISAGPGWYYAAMLSNWSAVGTTPQFAGCVAPMSSDGQPSYSAGYRSATLAGQTAFATLSGVPLSGGANNNPCIGFY